MNFLKWPLICLAGKVICITSAEEELCKSGTRPRLYSTINTSLLLNAIKFVGTLWVVYKVPFKFQIRHIHCKAEIVTVHIWSTNLIFDISSYHQISSDPLNVGILKTYGENLVVAFFVLFSLSTMNVTSFSVCKLTLGASFQQIDRKYVILAFHIFKGKITLLSAEKHEPWLRILLRSVSLQEEAAEEDMFT